MEKLNKAVESFCEDCQLGINIENCRECLFNVLKGDGKPSSFKERKNDIEK